MNPSTDTPPVAGFDLDSAEQRTTAEIQLKHPVTGALVPAFISLAGPEHEIRRNFVFNLTRRVRADYAAARQIVARDPVEDAEDELQLLVASTLGWKGILVGGQELPFSAGACTTLYADPKRAWLRDQVKAALDKRELFIAASSVS